MKITKKTFDAVKPNECHCKINQTILSIGKARTQLEADLEVINNISIYFLNFLDHGYSRLRRATLFYSTFCDIMGGARILSV